MHLALILRLKDENILQKLNGEKKWRKLHFMAESVR